MAGSIWLLQHENATPAAAISIAEISLVFMALKFNGKPCHNRFIGRYAESGRASPGNFRIVGQPFILCPCKKVRGSDKNLDARNFSFFQPLGANSISYRNIFQTKKISRVSK